MRKYNVYFIATIFVTGIVIFSLFLQKQPKKIVKVSQKEPKKVGQVIEQPCGNNVAFLDRFKDLPCSQAFQETNKLIRSWGGASVETVCVSSREHFQYMTALMQMPWVDSFKQTVGDFYSIDNFCFNSEAVLYVKRVDLGNSFYKLGYFNKLSNSVMEFNPQFRGFVSMGNLGCIPSLTQHGYFFECDATTENWGEPPNINENVKPLYAKYQFNLDKKTFILIDAVNKELFQEPK